MTGDGWNRRSHLVANVIAAVVAVLVLALLLAGVWFL